MCSMCLGAYGGSFLMRTIEKVRFRCVFKFSVDIACEFRTANIWICFFPLFSNTIFRFCFLLFVFGFVSLNAYNSYIKLWLTRKYLQIYLYKEKIIGGFFFGQTRARSIEFDTEHRMKNTKSATRMKKR